MRGVFLLLGTNLADRRKNLETAIESIERCVGHVVSRSSIYGTAAWGIEKQPDFLNQAVKIETELQPSVLLGKILEIELQMGRQRLEKWGTRLIDIDILFYNNEIIDEPNLKIPHPEFKNRNFALAPMAEIASDENYPGTNESMKSLASKSGDTLSVWLEKK